MLHSAVGLANKYLWNLTSCKVLNLECFCGSLSSVGKWEDEHWFSWQRSKENRRDLGLYFFFWFEWMYRYGAAK